ncbi:DUF819 domain-containing protein [Xenorhabdus griffiniae]|uniref:DUF819 family protein n=1 Tax=Xenorhabdus griffiniae TaxID=351672 RepID=A0ABY9XGU5_9GAMM|nr:DUF819 family protein [Xenorhabdus griffiniae]MBD1228677.1 DUF819 domain-containing protein [Xenorhabdus griffiniae]MBE8588232.1 DUF819 domain-containing protein [Xenorhabdus griffiniae]WMV72156.1 DUF819 family protein [Xenorhabdus griffiniae]WNH01834.1 DUF819 family protein [Xenorhabdus griffiniae]
MKNTFITADNSLMLWAFIMIAVAAAIVAEQRFKWVSKIPGAVIALIIAVSASNLNIIPTEAPVYDAVWEYILPLAIPLLLFKTNLHSILKESGRLLILFLISSVATMVGTIVSFWLFRAYIPELDKISGMISASYTGGGVNFAAMAAKLETSQDMVASTIVADNFMMAAYFIILMLLSGWTVARTFWGSPYTDIIENTTNLDKSQPLAATYWKPKHIALKDIALSLAWSIFIVALSFQLSSWLKTLLGQPNNIYQDLVFSLISDKYLLLTTVTFIIVSIFKETFSKLNGTQELGTYAIYMFFVVIGIPASIQFIINHAPLLFAFVLVITMLNLVLTFAVGKVFKFSLEENILACNANIGGPTTAAAMAISRGWINLVGPIMVIGTVGYVIGNYVGTFVYFVVGNL